jgi:hypothetical protein
VRFDAPATDKKTELVELRDGDAAIPALSCFHTATTNGSIVRKTGRR